MGVLDTSIVFFLPFGIDALVIYLVASNRDMFWLYPLLASAGSIAGAAFTFWIGRKLGEPGLERLFSRDRLQKIQRRVRNGGALAIALPALMPPPFPFTPFVLGCGALNVSRPRFLFAVGGARILRFGAEGVLARTYGSGIVSVFESDTFRYVVFGFIVLAVIGTAVSAFFIWRNTRESEPQSA